jgi:DNA-directed RNA polymerase alpha subunit
MLPLLKIIKNEPQYVEFETENIDSSFLNAIRRICLSEIQGLAFHKILFEEYSCEMNEDMLSHRISMLPLCCKKKFLITPEECDCKTGCSKCEVEFTLDVKNNEKNILNVYSGDFRTSCDEVNLLRFPDNVNGILLCKLYPNEKIKLKTKAILGYGKDNEKWSATTVCYFQKKNDEKKYRFHLECNENQKALNILKESFKIFSYKLTTLKNKLKYFQQGCNKYIFPYCDTIMNPLLHEILCNFDPDVCYYKRGHFLEKKESQFLIETEDVEKSYSIIKETVNIMLSRLHLMEDIFFSLK